MGLYRTAWGQVVCVLGIVGTALAFLLLPAASVVALGMCSVLVVPLMGTAIYRQGGDDDRNVPSVGQLISVCALAAVGCIAVAGLLALFGVAALLALMILAACSPVVLRHLADASHADEHAPPAVATANAAALPAPPRAAPPLPTSLQPASCHLLSDADLCWQWRTSFAALQRAASATERLPLVEARSALLDELADRHPEGFARWLNSGARAASDPARFLTSTRHSHQPSRPNDVHKR